MIAAVVLVALVAVSLPLTMGFSVILWYGLFAAAACILIIGGVIKIADGLGASPGVGAALASPSFIWAANNFLGFVSHVPAPLIRTLSETGYVAFLAAAAGALRLVETMSRAHAALRVGYGILAASALLVSVSFVAHAMGWSFAKSASYVTSVRAVHVAAALVQYGAFIGAAVLITMRRDVEPWAGAVICLISAYMICNTIRQMFVVEWPGDLMFWLRPILMLVGGAAVWRMGSVLRAQARRESYAQS
jgi:hypothetical protein